MIRFMIFSIVAVGALLIVLSGVAGMFGGVVLLAASVAAFGLLVSLFTELTREN